MTADTYDPAEHVSEYVPRFLTSSQWAAIATEARRLLSLIGPATRNDGNAHLATLTRFLNALSSDGSVTMDLLTRENIDRFMALESARGVPKGTLTQLRPRLKRWLRAREGQECRPVRTPSRARTRNFEPYSDTELARLEAGTRTLTEEADRRALTVLIALVRGHGCPRDQVTRARLADDRLQWADRAISLEPDDPLRLAVTTGQPLITDLQWAHLRDAVWSELGLRLHHHRLRHVWLSELMHTAEAPWVTITRHGLTRGDLERVGQHVVPSDEGDQALITM